MQHLLCDSAFCLRPQAAWLQDKVLPGPAKALTLGFPACNSLLVWQAQDSPISLLLIKDRSSI